MLQRYAVKKTIIYLLSKAVSNVPVVLAIILLGVIIGKEILIANNAYADCGCPGGYLYNPTKDRCEAEPECPGGEYDYANSLSVRRCIAEPVFECNLQYTLDLTLFMCEKFPPNCPCGGSYDTGFGYCSISGGWPCPCGYNWEYQKQKCTKAAVCNENGASIRQKDLVLEECVHPIYISCPDDYTYAVTERICYMKPPLCPGEGRMYADGKCVISSSRGSELCCNCIDDDCDGETDEGCECPIVDNDSDGHTVDQGNNICPSGDDCDDSDPKTNPSAPEICGDGKDNDCDGVVDENCGGDCSENPNSTKMGSSVSLASGNLFHSQNITGPQGSSSNLSFTIYYNSADVYDGPLGPKWTHDYNTRVIEFGNTIVYIDKDGRRVDYNLSGTTYYADPTTGLHSKITKNADNSYTLSEESGVKHNFNPTGRITSIVDRNGNTVSLTYTGSDLTSITDASGRITALTYNSNRITSIHTPGGRIYSISYDSGSLSTLTDPMGASWTYTYDAGGNMLTKTDPLGHMYIYTYDKNGRLLSSQDPNGSLKTVNYYQLSKTAFTTEKNGAHWTYEYDEILNVPVKITDPFGNITTFQYDTNRNLRSKREADGRTTSYKYDTDGNRTEEVDAEGHITNYTYNTYGQVLTIKDPDNDSSHKTTFTYNSTTSNLTRVTDAFGKITSYTYGPHGERLTTTDPNNNTTTYAYDSYGNIASVTNALNQTTTFIYDIEGNLISTTDANGNTTAYQYDLSNRLLKEIRPDSGEINYEYDAAGNRTAVTAANGNRTAYAYDGLNRLIRTTDAAGNPLNYTYDAEGNILSMIIKDASNTLMTSTTYSYDILNRLIRTTNADNSYTEQTYDIHGNVLTRRDENGNITTYTYDAMNRLLSVTGPEEGATSYTYNGKGKLTSVTDANANTTTYLYDYVYRLVATMSPDTGTTMYTYDANGNMLTKTDANGTKITYIYDQINRQTAVKFPDTAQNITYTYDDLQRSNGRGRLTSMTDPSGTTLYDHDKMGRVTIETKQANNISHQIGYTYDANGNISHMTYPSGRKISYTYDQLNKVTSIADTYLGVTKTLASNITYLPFGDMATMTQGNGIATTKTYNNHYQLSGLNIGTQKQLSYTRDNAGNISAITDALDPAKNKTYTYDALSRLTDAIGPWGNITYTYGPTGNRRSETTGSGATEYHYTNNMLTSTTGQKVFSFNYDPSGNTTSDNGTQYIYNQNQRLSRVIDSGAITSEYTYNGKGQRTKKAVNGQTTTFHYDKDGLLIAESTDNGTVTSEYVYLNGSPLAKINTAISWSGYNSPDPAYSLYRASMALKVNMSSPAANSLKYYYTRLRLNLTSTSFTGVTITGNTVTVQGVGTTTKITGGVTETIPGSTFTATVIDGSPDAIGLEIRKPDGTLYYSEPTQAATSGNYTVDGKNIYYYHNDHLGTPMLMTDSSGQVVWNGEFLPFGEPLSITGTVINNLRFPGQYFDSETDIHYNYYRDYNPVLGRYVQADPIGLDKGRNHLFIYVKNSPVNLIDFFGLKWKFLWWHEDYGYWNIFSLKIKIDTMLYAVCQDSCTYEIKKVFGAYESLWDWTPTEPKSASESFNNLLKAIRRAEKEGCSKIEAIKNTGGQRFCDTLN